MENELKKRIMKRIYAVWFFRKIAPAVFLYMPFLAVVALRETANEFFVAKIIDNFLLAVHNSGFFGAAGFVWSAVANTPVLPSLIIVVSLGLFVLFFSRLFKSFRSVSLVRSY
ncbi:hypothetical protein KKB69_00065 [Patescibacteria group bacterium]|nr:hypothetical protein [Patescibacteria group bacterium]